MRIVIVMLLWLENVVFEVWNEFILDHINVDSRTHFKTLRSEVAKDLVFRIRTCLIVVALSYICGDISCTFVLLLIKLPKLVSGKFEAFLVRNLILGVFYT